MGWFGRQGAQATDGEVHQDSQPHEAAPVSLRDAIQFSSDTAALDAFYKEEAPLKDHFTTSKPTIKLYGGQEWTAKSISDSLISPTHKMRDEGDAAMARKFAEYAAQREKKLSPEGREALEVFNHAHVLGNTIFDASMKIYEANNATAASTGGVGASSHSHHGNITTGGSGGSGYATGIGGSGVWHGGSTSPYLPNTTYTYPSSPSQPSWEALLQKVVEAAVASAVKEVTETLKDIQEQIDEIWESLGEGE